MGLGKAKELIYTAKVLSGSEAGDIGLAEHVVPQNDNGDAAYVKALEIAKQICSNVRYKMQYIHVHNSYIISMHIHVCTHIHMHMHFIY